MMKNLSDQDIQFWNDNSYLVLRGFYKKQSSAISKWTDEVLAWERDDSKWLTDYEVTNPKQLARRENFVSYHPQLANILKGPDILDLISELMGEPAVLYKDRINPKFPGGGPHEAHQDGVAYEQMGRSEFDANKTPYISILISVDKATTENGCLQVVPNWPIDKLEILPMEFPDPNRPQYSKMNRTMENSLIWLPLATQPGDVVLFTERLPHRSFPNNSKKMRRIIYGVYNPRSVGDLHDQYFTQKRKHRNDPRYYIGNPHTII